MSDIEDMHKILALHSKRILDEFEKDRKSGKINSGTQFLDDCEEVSKLFKNKKKRKSQKHRKRKLKRKNET